MTAIDSAAVAERSRQRVWTRLDTAAPCRGADGAIHCPFCGRNLEVRRSVLGRLDELPDGSRPHVDGVQLKCAGDEGCAFRPDFDVPIPRDDWQAELKRRDGQRAIDLGYAPGQGDEWQDRLRALGYLPE